MTFSTSTYLPTFSVQILFNQFILIMQIKTDFVKKEMSGPQNHIGLRFPVVGPFHNCM